MTSLSSDSATLELPLEARGHVLHPRDRATIRMLQTRHSLRPLHSPLQCYRCAEYVEVEVSDGEAHALSECAMAAGHTTVITLEVPSGKIIVSDDLRPVYQLPREVEDALPEYNTHLGQARYTEAMAQIGCAYGPVRNTCPSLCRTGPDTYVITPGSYDEETDEEQFPGEELAGICTDLWAYSIADYADWLARGGDPSALGATDTVVEVAPGTYQFTHHTGEAGFDYDAEGMVIFTHIERIR